jgi:hypothetical protein
MRVFGPLGSASDQGSGGLAWARELPKRKAAPRARDVT